MGNFQLPKYGDPEFDPLKEAEILKERSRQNGGGRVTSGCAVSGCGMLFAIFPVIFAFLSTAAGHNMYNESDSSSGGAGLWALMFTIPVGAVIVLIGAIMGFVRMVKNAKQNGASGASENRQSEASALGKPTDPADAFDVMRVVDIYKDQEKPKDSAEGNDSPKSKD